MLSLLVRKFRLTFTDYLAGILADSRIDVEIGVLGAWETAWGRGDDSSAREMRDASTPEGHSVALTLGYACGRLEDALFTLAAWALEALEEELSQARMLLDVAPAGASEKLGAAILRADALPGSTRTGGPGTRTGRYSGASGHIRAAHSACSRSGPGSSGRREPGPASDEVPPSSGSLAGPGRSSIERAEGCVSGLAPSGARRVLPDTKKSRGGGARIRTAE
jgi:hypothetical protein